MSIAKEEIFGPVMCAFKFKTLEEVSPPVCRLPCSRLPSIIPYGAPCCYFVLFQLGRTSRCLLLGNSGRFVPNAW